MVRQVPEVGTGRDSGIDAALRALAKGNARRAEEICRERLASAPDSVEYLRLVARALASQSRLDEAETPLRRALALRPEFAPLHEDLGGVLVDQRRYDDAIQVLTTALKLDPQLPIARKRLGQAQAALGHGKEADSTL